MTAEETTETLTQIDKLLATLWEARAHFPYLPAELVGERQLRWPEYYGDRGFHVVLEFATPLTDADIERLNAIGRWLNENAVVRLVGVLEAHGVISKREKIDKSLPGHAAVDIARRLRHVILKEGRYKADKPEHQELARRIEETVALKDVEAPPGFSLDIDRVLEPLFFECGKYVEARSER